jgi:hypothetical protein
MMVIVNYHYQQLSTMMTGMMDNLYDWEMNGITNYNGLQWILLKYEWHLHGIIHMVN